MNLFQILTTILFLDWTLTLKKMIFDLLHYMTEEGTQTVLSFSFFVILVFLTMRICRKKESKNNLLLNTVTIKPKWTA